LEALKQLHDDEVEAEVTNLQSALGADAAARLDLYVRTHINANRDSATEEEQRKETVVRYNLFLMQVNHNTVASAGGSGKAGNRIGPHPAVNYQQMLGFTDAEFALVCAAAQRLEEENKKISDAQRPMFQAYYASIPPSPELMALSQQREAAINKEVAELQRVLGPELSARLYDFVRAHLHVNTATLDSNAGRAKEF
jgi:hypothetical protein